VNDGVLEEWAASTEEGWRGILSALDRLLATPDQTARTIIALERAALDRWGKGDPDGFLEISDADVVYFDPFVPARVDSKEALRAVYDAIRGQLFMTGYEMVAPRVQLCGDIAVLTFNFVSHGAEGDMRWNTTEVYRRRADEWRIVHTHWSLTQPKLA
jgi:ketosteroid isomerase-like protein